MFESANMIILKVTRDCNLRCDYCYLKNKDNFKGERIKFDVFKKIVDRIVTDKLKIKNSWIKDNIPKISVIFHGGEPLMLDTNYFSKMLKYLTTKFNDNNIEFDLGLQTNLTLLTEAKLALLSKYNINVGISFDGIKSSNELRTKVFKNSDYFKKLNLLEKYNVSYGVLIVVGENNYKNVEESVEYLMDNFNIRGVKVNYAEDVNNIGGEVSGELFFEYAMKPFVKQYIEKAVSPEGNINLYINQFMIDILSYAEVTSKSNCGGKVCGGGINIIEVEPDGEINLCGRYSEKFDEAYLSNIDYEDYFRLNQFRKYINFSKNKHEVLLKTECDNCIADAICDHGCMAFHLSKTGKYGTRTDLVCPMFKSLYNYMLQHQKEIFESFLKNTNENNEQQIFLSSKNKITKIKSEGTLFSFIKKLGYSASIDSKNNHNIIFTKEKK